MKTATRSHTTDFASPRPGPRLRQITIAGSLILLTLAAVTFLMLPKQQTMPPAGQSSPPAAAPAETSPAQQPSNSDSHGVSRVVPTAAPDGVSWHLVGQVAVPVSTTDGPSRIGGGQASGYTRSPVGALIAAAQISTRAGYSAGRSSWEPTLQQQFVPGPDRDRLLALLRQAHEQGQPPAGPGALAPLAGFRYISYTPDAATIGLVRRAASGTYALTTLTVRWHDGDWAMVAPPAGHWPAVTATVTDLTGVIAWGAG